MYFPEAMEKPVVTMARFYMVYLVAMTLGFNLNAFLG